MSEMVSAPDLAFINTRQPGHFNRSQPPTLQYVSLLIEPVREGHNEVFASAHEVTRVDQETCPDPCRSDGRGGWQ